ncbi:helix-turn-helix domain-containing protein [Paenibacillus typhae]|uniref:Transposase and inactivated derivatives n=1 Tax=Paenibacillus typhae TaxID=1174501 RepID=A0A1G8Y248_9BACL|nr:helix-turn-helix domain-containing protein [Paenibacillus typhae]SDJ96892.1 Transposase and inactivated derivatives [Paenibacillus typhae]
MGDMRRTYDEKNKKKEVDLYLKKGLGYKSLVREMGIDDTLVRRWVKHFEVEALKGLEEKEGRPKDSDWADPSYVPKIQRPRLSASRQKIYAKKALTDVKGGMDGRCSEQQKVYSD